MKYYILPIVALLSIGCSPSSNKMDHETTQNKFSDSVLVNIHEWKDRRQTTDLIQMLDHEAPLYRAEAAMALASCLDTLAVPSLCQTLYDSVEQVSENSAYALGQTGSMESGYSLMTYIEENASLAHPSIFWEAAGACADSMVTPRILDYLLSNGHSEGASRALYRLAIRRKITSAYAPVISNQIIDGSTDDKLLAIHSILRSRDVDFNELDTLVCEEMKSTNLDIRIAAAGAIGKIPSEYNRPHLEQILRDPAEDINVLISGLRSYSQYAPCDTAIVSALIHHSNRDVALTACRLLEHIDKDEKWISRHIATPQDPFVEAKVLSYMPKFIVDHSDDLMKQMRAQKDPYAQAAWINALSHDPSLANDMVEIMVDAREKRIVSTSACESLIAMSASEDWDSETPFLDIVKKGCATQDITILALFSGHIAQNAASFRDQSDFAFLEESMAKLSLPQDIETYYEIQKALAALRDEELEIPKPVWNHPIDWEFVQSLPAKKMVKVSTNRGDYMIELDIENAPASASNFLDLIDKEYFTNKIFHRVVPNFVIQTGCPRGDGYGSVPYSIRSEFDLHDYRTGACGMASAGNDTESCQWFVTHSPTPHLEGRYSIFGYVTQGMEVVNSIHQGDTIFSISHQ